MIRRQLSLDVIDGPAPEVVAVLGTRTPTLDPSPFYYARERVMRVLRRRFPGASYACLSEFTTGKGTNAGGRRRPHWNMLIKGVPADQVDAARELVIPEWCRLVDAIQAAQYVEPLRDTAAFMRYVADHFTKTSQQPPRDQRWKHKQRFNASRDYFNGRTRAEAREAAWWSLQLEREIVKAQRAGASDPVSAGQAACDQLRQTTWAIYDPAASAAPPELVRDMTRAAANLARWEALSGSVAALKRAA